MARLSLEQIQAIDDRKEREVSVPEWGGEVVVRGLTAQQINECTRRAEDPKRKGEVNAEVRNGWYLVEGLVDPKITLNEAEQWLTERAFGPVSAVLGAILEESGLAERSKSGGEALVSQEPTPSV
jgi:hypothetical protein